MDIKTYSDIVLDAVGIDDSIVNYEEEEPHTTKIKTMDFSRAIDELDHDPKVSPEEGIKRTVDWMRKKYSMK